MVGIDGIEDDIHIADRLVHIDRVIVDHLVSAQGVQEFVIGRAGGADHVRAARFRDLHREVADAARRGMDQHPLPLLHIRRIDQGLPGGERRQRDGRGLNVIEVGGFAGERAGRSGHVLGGRAVPVRVGEHAEDLVTGLEEGHADTDGDDLAGDVPAEDERRRGQEQSGAATVTPVGGVEGGGAHAHQNLARTGLRNRALHLGQHLGAAERVLADGAHGLGDVLAHEISLPSMDAPGNGMIAIIR